MCRPFPAIPQQKPCGLRSQPARRGAWRDMCTGVFGTPRRYAPGVTYGEMFLQNEYEMSCYNLDEADVEGQRQRFELYDKCV